MRTRSPIMLMALLLAVVLVAACGGTESEVAKVDGVVTDAQEITSTVEIDDGFADNGHDVAEAALHDDDHDAAEVALHDDDHDAADDDILEISLAVIEGSTLGFDPDVIEVPVGQRVRLTLINDGRAEHDVEIVGLLASHLELEGGPAHDGTGGGHHDADLVSAHAMPGTAASVLFTPTIAGVYEFACTLPGHKEAGMIGKIVVTQSG